MEAHRRLVVYRGTPAETARRAQALLSAYRPESVCWVSQDAQPPFTAVPPRAVRKLLGRSFGAVVLDLHQKYSPEVLGQVHGFVLGEGALVLRMPPEGQTPREQRTGLDVHPFHCAQVGVRLFRHLERAVARGPAGNAGRLAVPNWRREGTPAQEEAVQRLARHFLQGAASVAVLTADRGRGKSSALGLALAQARRERPGLSCAVTAAQRQAVQEVLRFAGEGADFIPLEDLLRAGASYDVILVDEAAQLPVPLLQHLVATHPRAQLAFATTTRGYEGTGRGFALRFMQWLRAGARQVQELTLDAPIRWREGDALEAFVFDALLLDAAPHELGQTNAAAQPRALDRSLLLEDERLLRGFFGLLVHAHYRTTPGDLWRILDAPNIRLYAMMEGEAVVGATMVALEGGLPEELLEILSSGQGSVRGHALPQSLVSHLGHREAGRMRMVRSVRIAVHPARRRRGIGSALMDFVHAQHAPDLFGTLFGATPEVIAFRRRRGYEPVRISASRGARTGEPSVLMIRPVSAQAAGLLHALRAAFARDLPVQRALLHGEAPLEEGLIAALESDLPAPAGLSPALLREHVLAYAYGARTFESVALSVCRFAEENREYLPALPPAERAVVESRVLALKPWPEVTKAARLATPRGAMRLLRVAVRHLVERAEPAWCPGGDNAGT